MQLPKRDTIDVRTITGIDKATFKLMVEVLREKLFPAQAIAKAREARK